ncbi:hypothetical protein CRUP_006661 [Coryphaenoides rupestris]|nr:hypothetical protein CRUP_006661 [Coryphaenoides rupestris]
METTTTTTTITTTRTQQHHHKHSSGATITLHAPRDHHHHHHHHPNTTNTNTTNTNTHHPGTAGFPGGKSKVVLKRQRSGSPELLRCKRRLSFQGLGYGGLQQHQTQHQHPQQQLHQQQIQPPTVAVARRNERERNRVKQVNAGFQTLRQHVPSGSGGSGGCSGGASRKMSKVETLRSAVEYIRALQQLLDEHDAVSAAFRCGLPPSPTLSHGYSAEPESPHSSSTAAYSSSSSTTYSSDEVEVEVEVEPLSSEEQELLDFTTWFDRY